MNTKTADKVEFTNHISSLWKIITSDKPLRNKYKKGFLDYQTVRRKYILKKVSEITGKDCMEPAPLLDKKLLDIGCGGIEMAKEMVFRGAEVTALDISEDVIESSKQKANKAGAPMNFIQGRPEDLVTSGETFDILLCLDVLSYAQDQKRFVWAMDKLLNKGGIVIFSEIHNTFWSKIWHVYIAEKLAKWVPEGTFSNYKTSTQQNITSSIQSSKFNITHIQNLSFSLKRKKWTKDSSTAIRYIGVAVKK